MDELGAVLHDFCQILDNELGVSVVAQWVNATATAVTQSAHMAQVDSVAPAVAVELISAALAAAGVAQASLAVNKAALTGDGSAAISAAGRAMKLVEDSAEAAKRTTNQSQSDQGSQAVWRLVLGLRAKFPDKPSLCGKRSCGSQACGRCGQSDRFYPRRSNLGGECGRQHTAQRGRCGRE